MDGTNVKSLASTLGRLVGICAVAIFLVRGYQYVSGTGWWVALTHSPISTATIVKASAIIFWGGVGVVVVYGVVFAIVQSLAATISALPVLFKSQKAKK